MLLISEEEFERLSTEVFSENVIIKLHGNEYSVNEFKEKNSSGGDKQHGPRLKISKGSFGKGHANIVLDRSKGLPIFDHSKTSFKGVENIKSELEDVALAASKYYEEFKIYARYDDHEKLQKKIDAFNEKSEKEKADIIKKQREKLDRYSFNKK